MSYEEILNNVAQQCRYEPVIVNAGAVKPFDRVVILGMGGSRLGPDLLKAYRPDMDIHVHSDYGLPALTDEKLKSSLIIANSHSGGTAEVLDGANEALKRGFNLAVIDSGGPLAELAQSQNLVHIITPDHDLPPRTTVISDLAALMALLNIDRAPLVACASIAAADLSQQAGSLASALFGSVPIIYAPTAYYAVGYCWKIIMNETAKVPAFCNRFPELDHNELAGYDPSSRELFQKFHVVCLCDRADARMTRRIEATIAVLQKQNIPVTTVDLAGASMIEKMVSSFFLAHWTGLKLAEKRGVDPIAIPIVEELKKSTR